LYRARLSAAFAGIRGDAEQGGVGRGLVLRMAPPGLVKVKLARTPWRAFAF